jgi:hypothetical protein
MINKNQAIIIFLLDYLFNIKTMNNKTIKEDHFNEGACCIAKSILYLVLLYFFSNFFYAFLIEKKIDIITE